MFGKGLLKGLNVTWKEFWSKKFTVQYPDKQHPKPPRFHGRFQLNPDACIVCNLCVNACPNGVIEIESEKVEKKKYLTKYVVNIQYCLFCGMCVDACNKGALKFGMEHDMSQFFIDDVPLVLADRKPPQPEDKSGEGEETGDKAGNVKNNAGSSSETKDGESAGEAPNKEGQ